MHYQDFEACIFDFDGVIIDSEPLHTEAKRSTLNRFQIPYSVDFFADFKGRTDTAYFDFIAAQPVAGSATVEELESYKRVIYSQPFENVSLVPGVQSFLTAARRSFKKLGLATSATRRDFVLADYKFQLAQQFDVMVTGEDISRHKPDPDPYLKTLAAMDVAGPAALVIEDSPSGIRSAKLAKCQTVGLTTTFQPQELYKAGADIVAATFAILWT